MVGEGDRVPEVNKFEQIFNDGHQMSLAGEVGPLCYPVTREKG